MIRRPPSTFLSASFFSSNFNIAVSFICSEIGFQPRYNSPEIELPPTWLGSFLFPFVTSIGALFAVETVCGHVTVCYRNMTWCNYRNCKSIISAKRLQAITIYTFFETFTDPVKLKIVNAVFFKMADPLFCFRPIGQINLKPPTIGL